MFNNDIEWQDRSIVYIQPWKNGGDERVRITSRAVIRWERLFFQTHAKIRSNVDSPSRYIVFLRTIASNEICIGLGLPNFGIDMMNNHAGMSKIKKSLKQ